jgi:hypothetical protein
MLPLLPLFPKYAFFANLISTPDLIVIFVDPANHYSSPTEPRSPYPQSVALGYFPFKAVRVAFLPDNTLLRAHIHQFTQESK